MRHARRIERLERAVEALRPPPTCPACGGPRPGYNALVLVVDDDAPPEPRCRDCELIIDADGRARAAYPRQHDRPATIKVVMLGSAS
jgi:hypothetical protein